MQKKKIKGEFNLSKKKAFYNSGLWFGVVSVVFFAVMFFFNHLTPYVADDYVYMFNFRDGTPIADGGILDIFRSMYGHSLCMNGRAVSHGFEQLFMLYPKFVFNLVNTFLWVFMVYTIYRISNYGKKHNFLLYLGIGMAVWYYTPSFGQVYLWQVGSVNYLWGMMWGLLFIAPFVYRFTHGKDLLKHGWQKVVFCILSVIVGYYIEITSFIVILLAVIFLVLIPVMGKGKKFSWLTVATVMAIIGYILLLMMPTEVGAKQAQMDIGRLIDNIRSVTTLLKTHTMPIMAVWAVFFVLGLTGKIAKERLILSGVFAFGAVSAAYMMIIARYIPDRCMITTTVLAIIAVAVLIPELLKERSLNVTLIYGVLLSIVFAFSFVEGGCDIVKSHMQVSEREAVIEQKKAAGELDLQLPLIKWETKYSPFYALIDMQTATHDTWPNNQMSHYYGVNSIIGVE